MVRELSLDEVISGPIIPDRQKDIIPDVLNNESPKREFTLDEIAIQSIPEIEIPDHEYSLISNVLEGIEFIPESKFPNALDNRFELEGSIRLMKDMMLAASLEIGGVYEGLTGLKPNIDPSVFERVSNRVNPKVAELSGNIVGGLSLFMGVSSMVNAPQISGNIFGRIFPYSPRLARYIAPAVSDAVVFSGVGGIHESIRQISEGKLDFIEFGKTLIKDGAFGFGFGAIARGLPGAKEVLGPKVPDSLFRIIGASGYGFVTALAEGADKSMAVVNGAVTGLFVAMTNNDVTAFQKQGAYKSTRKMTVESIRQSALEKGYPQNVADNMGAQAGTQFDIWIGKQGGMENIKLRDFEKGAKELQKTLADLVSPSAQAKTTPPLGIENTGPTNQGTQTAPPSPPSSPPEPTRGDIRNAETVRNLIKRANNPADPLSSKLRPLLPKLERLNESLENAQRKDEPKTFDQWLVKKDEAIRNQIVEAQKKIDVTPNTEDEYSQPDPNFPGDPYRRIYSPERTIEHDRIVNDPRYSRPESFVKEGENPEIYIVVGPPGAGKNTMIKNYFQEFSNRAIEVDNDDIKEMLPGFDRVLAKNFHAESDYLQQRIIKNALDNRQNIILPIIGKGTDKLKELISLFKDDKYKIKLINVDLPVLKSADRATERFIEQKGRFVSPKYVIDEVGLKPSKNYDKFKQEVDSYVRFTNDVQRGQKPILIETSEEGVGRGRSHARLTGVNAEREARAKEKEELVIDESEPEGPLTKEQLQFPPPPVDKTGRVILTEEEIISLEQDPNRPLTISESMMKDLNIEGLDIKNLIIEGQTKEAIRKRARDLWLNHVESNKVKREIIDNIVNTVGRFSITKDEKDILEELRTADIPPSLRARGAKSFDEFAQDLISNGYLDPDSSTSDVIAFIESLRTGRDSPISSFITQAEQELLQEYTVDEGRFKRVQPELRREIDKSLGIPGPSRKTIQLTETQALRQSIRDQARSAKIAEQKTKEEILSAQNQIIKYIDGSNLSNEDKGKLLRFVKNIQNLKQYREKMPVLHARIESMVEIRSRRELRSSIKNELKSIKPKRQSGKPVGKFTPEIQDILDQYLIASRYSKDEALIKITDNVSRYPDLNIPPEIVTENSILESVSGLSNKTSDELNSILNDIRDIKRGGRLLNKLNGLDQREKIEEAVSNFVKEITGDKGIAEGAPTFGVTDKDRPGSISSVAREFFRDAVYGWNDILNILSQRSNAPVGKSFIENFGDVFKETDAERGSVGNANKKIRDMISNSYGVSKDSDIINILNDNNKPVNLGEFTNAKGIKDSLIFTKDQAIAKYMQLQDPSLSETFFNENGMAYTDEIVQAINNFLTPADKSFANEMLNYYREDYAPINEIYKQIAGVNLPFNYFYSPIRRFDFGKGEGEGFSEFLKEINVRTRVTNGSLKSRVKNIKPIVIDSAVGTLQSHISNMEHFKHWALKIRDLQTTFGDPRVKRAITEQLGSGTYKSIFKFLTDFTRGYADPANRWRLLDEWRLRTTQVTLGIRPSIMVKQLASIPAYLEVLSVNELIGGMYDFFRNPIENYKILKQSNFLKFRGQNFERDIKDATNSDQYKQFRQIPGFINLLLMNVQIGDQGAIVLGGWGVYLKALKEGKTHDEALDIFSRVSNSAQQSADLSEQSNFQRGGSIARLFTMYSTTPLQYMRKVLGAVRNYKNGRMPLGKAARIIFIFNVLLPIIFQAISEPTRTLFSGAKNTARNLVRSSLTGNLNGIFILGPMMDQIVRAGLGLRAFDMNIPIFDKPYDDLKRSIDKIEWDDITMDDFVEASDYMLGVAGFATRIPLREVKDMVLSLSKIYDEDYYKGIPGLLGWSEYSLRGANEDGSDEREGGGISF